MYRFPSTSVTAQCCFFHVYKRFGHYFLTNHRRFVTVLIRDWLQADILFEKYDEGFLSALSSLTSQSKRPLIFTMNNINYPHLAKYNHPRNLILKFAYPSRSLLSMIVVGEYVSQSVAHIMGFMCDGRRTPFQLGEGNSIDEERKGQNWSKIFVFLKVQKMFEWQVVRERPFVSKDFVKSLVTYATSTCANVRHCSRF